jgi:hypothetical protein
MPSFTPSRARRALIGAAAAGLSLPLWLRAGPALAQGRVLASRMNADIDKLDRPTGAHTPSGT